MTITVLVATFRGTQSITIHDDEAAAASALMSFVELHWPEQFDEEHGETILSENERLQRFFADDRNSYIMAEADLSLLEAFIDSVAPEPRE
ncbi:hypothetical protein [Sphingomonas psychrotolerans]|uniref:Uncharacterized protein n=1 Tax=Sphingomonas psychrotolerans TaxID=1327635 RepID=A0A2K8MLW0_9SPHN|nr:hypothetical protein [Sphingomonas psychrotolerans]ATY34853.1 hypothetical protein CVN68_22330 [Sphingomonas psychrotolerans]